MERINTYPKSIGDPLHQVTKNVKNSKCINSAIHQRIDQHELTLTLILILILIPILMPILILTYKSIKNSK